jgi:DHA3 family tetracycline resistance protein-like MFS transporter
VCIRAYAQRLSEIALKNRKQSAHAIYLIVVGADKLTGSLFATVQMVYFATRVTSDPFQLVLIWTVFQISVLLFEIPTGVIADIYSRRLSVILGFLVTSLGSLFVGVCQTYSLVLLGMVILGIGDALLSGALDAWIADEIGNERVGPVYMRGSQVAQIAILAGIPIGTGLGTIALNVPILLSGALYLLLALFLTRAMPEHGFQPIPPEKRRSWHTMFSTFKEGVQLVRGRSVLVTILGISAVAGLASAGFEGLWAANMLENVAFPTIGNFEPVVWFGGINAAVSIMSLIGIELFRRKVDVGSQTVIVRTLMVTASLSTMCMIVFGLVGDFWLAAAVYSLSYSLRIASSPLFKAWINQNVESSVRATVLSMDNQINYLGRIAGGPIIGVIGSATSLRAALVAAGLTRVPVTVLLARLVLQANERSE